MIKGVTHAEPFRLGDDLEFSFVCYNSESRDHVRSLIPGAVSNRFTVAKI